MKKIMFNDKYGLTQAVLSGRKTMTRRIITCPKEFKGEWVAGFYVYKRQSDNAIIQYPCMYDADECAFDGGEILPKYKVGEVVAIAQSYRDVVQGGYPIDSRYDAFRTANWGDGEDGALKGSAGWTNKMFVRADLMPHHIRITDVKVERLQDISNDDCLREGVLSSDKYAMPYGIPDSKAPNKVFFYYSSPREAFAALIDKVSGKGVWDSNPWVFVYEFILID